MTKKEALKLFEDQKIRAMWDDEQEKWYFSIVDVVAVLSGSTNAKAYWIKLKQRIKVEGNEIVTNCHSLKLRAEDGKMRMTDMADTEQLFQIIQFMPSTMKEAFMVWMAQVATERLRQMQDDERHMEQILNADGRFVKGSLKVHFPGVMLDPRFLLNLLVEASAMELVKNENPKGLKENANVARRGGSVAKTARNQLESQLGRSVVTSLNAKDYLKSLDKGEDGQENTEE